MGCDSQVTRGGSRTTLTNRNNFEIWKVKGVDNCLMGHVGDVRDACVVKIINDLIPELAVLHGEVNYEYVIECIVPRIISILCSHRYIFDSGVFESMGSRFLFAYKNLLFVINGDGGVIEVDDQIAIGSGESEVIGSLLSTENIEVKEKIIRAIKATAAHDIYVDYPIIITNTQTCEFETIFEKD